MKKNYEMHFSVHHCETVRADNEEHARQIIQDEYGCFETVMELEINDVCEE